MTVLRIDNFSLVKGNFSLKNISLKINSKEIFVILGETGCGKTLLLESIAGFYKGDSGVILRDDKPIVDISLEKRNIGFVYQDYGLFPHMNAYDNISYGLKRHKVNREIIRDKVYNVAQSLSITHILNQHPGTLSGGERQRTALARTLIMNPDILLLDEPFSALDSTTKKVMYQEIHKIHKIHNCTIILVTHSFEEAQMFGMRIGIMEDGQLKAVRNGYNLFEPYKDISINRFLGLTVGNG